MDGGVVKLVILGVAAYVAYRLLFSGGAAGGLPQATSAGTRIAGGDPQATPSGQVVVPTSRSNGSGWYAPQPPALLAGSAGGWKPAPVASTQPSSGVGKWDAHPVPAKPVLCLSCYGPAVQARSVRGAF